MKQQLRLNHRLLWLFVSLLVVQTTYAQMMPIPPHSSVYSGIYVRGFWFVAPTSFTITGLRMPPEAGTGTQSLQVMKCRTPFPVSSTAQSTNFIALYYTTGAPNGVIQTVNIPVAAGDTIGILGTTAGISNSYSASGTWTSTIGSFTVGLGRMGYQGSIDVSAATAYWGEALTTAGQIGRVEVYYTIGSAPPPCISSPANPANNSTTVCSGTTQLRWPKASGASSYDVYLNAGTASPTTIVSANQTDTFYNATTAVGPYKWRIVPKNTNGPATGCSDFAFTTVANVTPTVSISVVPNDTICAGVMATFTATHVNGGTSPGYQWKKNGTNVGTGGNTYASSSLADKDTIRVVMTSTSSACLTTNTATSNAIVMTILPVPATTIAASGPTAFCAGGAVTLSASSSGGGNFQWTSNGTPVAGATSATYTASTGGVYRANAMGANGCTATSDSIVVTVYSKPFPPVNRIGNVLSTHPFYTSYQWYRGGQMIPGANSNQYTVTQDGMYMVHVGDTAGCEGNSAPTPVNSLAVGGTVVGNDISVYPNPASGMVYINAATKVNITVRSIDGKLVLAAENTDQINISKLAQGVYNLYITDRNQRLLKIEKLVRGAD